MKALSCRTADPFRGSEAVRAGAVTPARLRSSEFRWLYPDVYVGSSVEVDVRVRVRAAALWAGPGGVVAGPLAALAWGADCPSDAPEVVLPRWRPAPATMRIRTDRLRPDEIATRYAVPVTSEIRTAFDLARTLPLVDAVAAVDAVAGPWGFGEADLRALVHAHGGIRGLEQVRRVIGLMDPRAESLMETRTRLVLVLRRVPSPVSQHVVVLPNGRRARLDLAWPAQRVAVEYDGADHRSAPRHGRDLDRDADLQDLGWDVNHVTGRQVYGAPDRLAGRIAAKVAARSR